MVLSGEREKVFPMRTQQMRGVPTEWQETAALGSVGCYNLRKCFKDRAVEG